MDFSVRKTDDLVAEKRGWLRGKHGTDPGSNPSVTLDIPAFAGLHADGFIPSGTVVALNDDGLAVPYDSAGTDDAYGLLFNSENVAAGQTRGVNAVVRHGNIDPSRLPFESGKGAFDDGAKADLPLIDWK